MQDKMFASHFFGDILYLYTHTHACAGLAVIVNGMQQMIILILLHNDATWRMTGNSICPLRKENNGK